MRAALRQLAPGDATHPGLVLQRYLADAGGSKEARVDRATLLRHAQQAARSASLHELYREAFLRWVRSFPAEGHRTARLGTRTGSRLAVGLGTANVLEVGLRLHQTYGTPMIPGSAIKGLAASFCHASWGQADDANAREAVREFRRGGRYHALLFGTTEDRGAIVFHDAWLTPESLSSALHLDVMTPHHPGWQLDANPPSDLDSPVPVSFLSVAGMFDVRLSWSGPAGLPASQVDAWTALAMELVTVALDERGIGGKTRSGYGRLERPELAPQRRVEPPRTGARVEARLIAGKTKNGGWKATHLATQLSGAIKNFTDIPADKLAGDIVELIVTYANPRELGFRYPTRQEPARATQPPSAEKPRKR